MKLNRLLWVVAFWLGVVLSAPATTYYVDVNCTNPVAPYSDWSVAATNIQDAVDAATSGDLVIVTNGVYEFGGRPVPPNFLTNRAAVDKPLTLESVNGPNVTVIQGYVAATFSMNFTNSYRAVRCVYLTNGATLIGFTLANGGNSGTSTNGDDYNGGGIWCATNAVVTNCIIAGSYSFNDGGGSYQGNYFNCLLTNNTAVYAGGGAANGTLFNCTLESNLQWNSNLGSGGGAYSCTLSNCTLIGNHETSNDNGSNDRGGGGGAYSSILNYCILAQNSGYCGGGAQFSTLVNCMVVSNTAQYVGGGTYNCILTNCTLSGNSVAINGSGGGGGGGAEGGTLNNCVITGNMATYKAAGGVADAVLNNCKLYGNSAAGGGGAVSSYLENCIVISNVATLPTGYPFVATGGGVVYCSLTNCTIAENSSQLDGGTEGSTLNNCIVYFNTALTNSNYDTNDSLNFCCTTPLPTNGIGNFTNNPLFVNPVAGDYHLQSNSPCINSGNNSYVTSITDLDGHPRIVGGTVDIGAYEFQGNIRYVNLNSTNPVAPYSDWSVAATNIQDAVDASTNGDLVLVTNGIYQTGARVTSDGTTNRVVITNAITLQSVNGPLVTLIQGNPSAIRCVYMSSNSVLSGFTLTNGGANIGGGVYASDNSSAVVTNCMLIANVAGSGGGAYQAAIYNSSIINNSAYNGGGLIFSTVANSLIWSNSASNAGGGAYLGTLMNCRVLQNVASIGGGAANSSTLQGCLVVSNVATFSYGSGGGADSSTVINCTVVGNTSTSSNGAGGLYECGSLVVNSIILNNTAIGGNYSNFDNGGTSPRFSCARQGSIPVYITNDPAFIDPANGNYRLQSNSPCINSGDNSQVTAGFTTDLDGNPRVVDRFVDMGAYEYQTANFTVPFVYAQQYKIPLDGTIDSDGIGMNNWLKAYVGLNPTNPASVFRIASITGNASGITAMWQNAARKTWYLQRGTNLSVNSSFVTVYTNKNLGSIPFPASFTDTSATNGGVYFYRLEVP